MSANELLKHYFPIPSQTSDGDKVFLLKSVEIVKRFKNQFSYLEIGSFLGGSLTPFLMDPHCSLVFSIDDRGRAQPDERGVKYDYAGISHQTMIENLLSKGIKIDNLKTFDGSIDALEDPPQIKFDIAFIDGEHTDFACFRDFLWVEPLLETDSILLFHDSTLIYKAISCALLYMKKNGKRFAFVKNKLSDISGFFMGAFSEVDFFREFGEQEDWSEFCTRSETYLLHEHIANRVKLSYDIQEISTRKAF